MNVGIWDLGLETWDLDLCGSFFACNTFNNLIIKMRKPFLEFLKEGIILFDGAMGTEVYTHGIYINTCFDELNLTKPKLITEIHKSYIKAGADAIETNTFGANIKKLQKFGLEKEAYKINYQGAKIARSAAGDDIYVAGS